VDLDRSHLDRPLRSDRECEIAEADRIEGLEAVVAAAADVAEAAVLLERDEASVRVDRLGGLSVDPRARGRRDRDRDVAGDLFAEVDDEDAGPAVSGIERERRDIAGNASERRGGGLIRRASPHRIGVEIVAVGRVADRDDAPTPTLADELRDRSREERAVGVRRRPVIAVPPDVVGRELDRRAPARIVEAGLPPASGERASIADFGGYSTDPGGAWKARPCRRLDAAPRGVGSEPAIAAEVRFECECSPAETVGRRARHPPRRRVGVVTGEHRERVLTRSQVGREIEKVEAKRLRMTPHRTARDLAAVSPEHEAGIGDRSRGQARRDALEGEGPPEEHPGSRRVAVRIGLDARPRRDRHRSAPDPASSPAPRREVPRGLDLRRSRHPAIMPRPRRTRDPARTRRTGSLPWRGAGR
jgi:hypothetical protein